MARQESEPEEEWDYEEDDEPPILVAISPPSQTENVGVKDAEDINKMTVIPVTILTGFLGSGKTSLLNHLLVSNDHGKRIAVIENEFSEGLGIEGMIAKSGVDGSSLEGFFELNNGCICCTVKDNLVATLEQLVRHKHKFDYLIIETTGVANPGPVISCFWTDDELMSALKLDGVVCVIDALNFPSYLRDPEVSSDVRMQVCYADRVLLNKSDLVTEAQLQAVEAAVKGINSLADTQRTTFSSVVPEWVIGIDSFSMSNPLKLGLFASQGDVCGPCAPLPSSPSSSLPPFPPAPLFRPTQDFLTASHTPQFLSTEGFTIEGQFQLGKLKAYLDRVLYGNEGFEEDRKKQNKAGGHGKREGKGGEGKKEDFLEEGDVPGEDDFSWQRMRIFRMKGVLHIEGSPYIHILQSVHDLFDVQPSTFVSDNTADSFLNKYITLSLTHMPIHTHVRTLKITFQAYRIRTRQNKWSKQDYSHRQKSG